MTLEVKTIFFIIKNPTQQWVGFFALFKLEFACYIRDIELAIDLLNINFSIEDIKEEISDVFYSQQGGFPLFVRA